ncbi:MAG: DUF3604 domain-containing protein [Fidelibacterota bacterium]|nr:MAG: DUF3604 domain-containing protein [Candidatus Neomarinimicrobiota bacterium]
MQVTAEIEAKSFPVGERCSVELLIQISEPLTVGDRIEVQYANSWMVISGPSHTRELQHVDPQGEHYISVAAESDGAEFDLEIKKRHLPFPEGIVRHGRHIIATLGRGSIPSGTLIRIVYANTFAPDLAETDTVWVRVKGQAPGAEPLLTTTAGPAEHLRIIVPSGVEPGKEFVVRIVSLDRFDNRSTTRYENESLICSDGRTIVENLDFIGSIKVPVRLEKEGAYRFRFRDVLSNVVRVGRGCRGPYWGDIHLHTKLSHDGYGTEPYAYGREVSGLDFAGVTDHWQSLGQGGYQQTIKWAREAYEPGRFVTLLGDERNPGQFTGHHNLYHRDEESFTASAATRGNAIFADAQQEGHLQAMLDPSRAILIPHHTGLGWRRISLDGSLSEAIDLDACDDQGLRPVMEIYSHHGQSELWNPQHILSYEHNRMRRPERRSNVSISGPYYAQSYWMKERRLGVIGSSDEHSSQAGRRHGGIAAVWAEELTREAIFDALRNRRCYATTGERILVDFSVAGVPMGGVGQRKKGDHVSIELQVWCTDILLRAEVLRFRFGEDSAFVTIMSEFPQPESMDASFSLEDEVRGDCLYYARITQEPLVWPGMAWTSPVWIDIV